MFVGEWMIDVIMTSNLIFTSITLETLYSTDFNDLNCQTLSVFGGFPYWTRRNQHQESLTQMVWAISNCLKKNNTMENQIMLGVVQWEIVLCWGSVTDTLWQANQLALLHTYGKRSKGSTPQKLTWKLKMTPLKRNIIFQNYHFGLPCCFSRVWYA